MMQASDPGPFAGETGVRNAPAIVMRCAFIMYLREEHPESEIIKIDNRRYKNCIYFSKTAGSLCLDRKDPRFYHLDIESRPLKIQERLGVPAATREVRSSCPSNENLSEKEAFMTDTKISRLSLGALFASLVFIGTFILKIPTPGTGGYIHPGDALVILSGVFLGPNYGFLAAAVGSALADILGGYVFYAPITFAVKGCIALLAAIAFRKLAKTHLPSTALMAGGVIDILFTVLGYGIPEALIYGPAGALASAFPNFVQGLSGMLLAMVLYPILRTVLTRIPHSVS